MIYLGHAMHDAGALELRVQRGDRWHSGIFDSVSALQAAVEENRAYNVFCTLNRPQGVTVTNRMGGRALRDEDICRVVRLPFDFDPARPIGEPSTQAELDIAIRKRNALIAMLLSLQWPQPATATSGNGSHAIYRCLLQNSDETREMLAAIYRGLREDYSDEEVSFDAAVRNPARIWRLYGTVNRKGTATAERPHRLATVSIPGRWDGVAPKQIEALANRYAKQAQERPAATRSGPVIRVVGSGDFTTLDAPAWFMAHGALKRGIGGGRHAVTCPWTEEHSTKDAPHGTDTVIWEAEPGRWPTFHCSHAHCEGRTIRDVMRLWSDADAFCARTWRRSA